MVVSIYIHEGDDKIQRKEPIDLRDKAGKVWVSLGEVQYLLYLVLVRMEDYPEMDETRGIVMEAFDKIRKDRIEIFDIMTRL